ncbi:MAG: hypothetical protein U0Q22_06315 [Acidimicrobiales bacterium]
MNTYRFRSLPLLPVLVAVLLCAGCADDPTPRASRVSVVPTTSSVVAPTTVVVPSTKPLTTVVPSPLLTEIETAYDAAYADLLAAEAIPDENYPRLTDHIAPGQLEQWRSVIRQLRVDGKSVRPGEGSWRRVELLRSLDASRVEIVVCRLDRESTDGEPDSRTARYQESFDLIDGRWKWSGRQWLDRGAASDCALPS